MTPYVRYLLRQLGDNLHTEVARERETYARLCSRQRDFGQTPDKARNWRLAKLAQPAAVKRERQRLEAELAKATAIDLKKRSAVALAEARRILRPSRAQKIAMVADDARRNPHERAAALRALRRAS
jgi:hypothetical protein